MKTIVKYISTLLLVLLTQEYLQAVSPKIIQAEYFIDSDPGFGNATPIIISTPDTVLNIETNISVSSLSKGQHYITVRVRDSLGNWSINQTRVFTVYEPEPASPQITSAEYFIGNDPGQGAGTSLNIGIPSNSVSLSYNLDISSLSAGNYYLGVRCKDAYGRWTKAESRRLKIIVPEQPGGSLSSIEYYIDSDPGEGNRQKFTFTPQDNISTSFSIDVASLSKGLHNLSLILKDENGKQAIWQSRFFNLIQKEASYDIKSLAYYFDDELDTSSSRLLTFTPIALVDDTFLIDVSSLNAGVHKLRVAAINSNNQLGFGSSTKEYRICDILPRAAFTIDTVFAYLPFKPKNNTAGSDVNTTYTWEFSDGETTAISNLYEPTYTFNLTGNFQVRLIASNGEGCSDTTMMNLVVNEPQGCFADFLFNINSNQVTFTNVSTVSTNVRWDFGDGYTSVQQNPIHTYAQDGKYNVCMTNIDTSTRCLKKVCKDVIIGSVGCNANYTYEKDPVNVSTIHFTDHSSNTNEYYWDFGDGWVVKTRDASHTYSKEGIYKVCHWVRNRSTGCFDQSCQDIQVGITEQIPLRASFIAYVDKDQRKVYFSSNSSGNVTDYYWTFGDGNYDSNQEVNYVYARPGIYKVCLQVFDKKTGLSDEYCEQISVGDTVCNVVANFAAIVNLNREVVFQNKSIGENLLYYWNFGDGATSVESDPSHQYVAPGFYLVSLAIKNNLNQCVDYFSQFLKVGEPSCSAAFDYLVDPQSDSVTFINKSTGNLNRYFWNFGDGKFSFDPNPTIKYAASGIYKVSLTVADTLTDCKNSYSATIQVGKVKCGAQFSYFVDSSKNTVYFKNEVLGSSTNLYWSFGDGQAATVQNPVHKYKAAGYYKVSLNTFDVTNWCMDYSEELLLVGNSLYDCEADFTYQPDENTNRVKFFDQSKGNIIGYYWNFGDGVFESDVDPVHLYNVPGYYNVCHLVVNNRYITNIKCKHVVVQPGNVNICRADFNFVVDSVSRTVYLTDASEGKPTQWLWTFGNGTSDTKKNTSVIYSKAGYYLVGLKITNTQTGCTSKTAKLINVAAMQKLKAGFAFDKKPYNKKAGGYPVDFIGAGLGDQARLKWTFGDTIAGIPQVDSTTNTPTHVYQVEGKYLVCYEISDPITQQRDSVCQWVKTSEGVGIPNLIDRTLLDISVSPNPFVNYTTIRFDLIRSAQVDLSIFDLTGRKLNTIIHTVKPAGSIAITYNASTLANGSYLIKLLVDNVEVGSKVIIKQ